MCNLLQWDQSRHGTTSTLVDKTSTLKVESQQSNKLKSRKVDSRFKNLKKKQFKFH